MKLPFGTAVELSMPELYGHNSALPPELVGQLVKVCSVGGRIAHAATSLSLWPALSAVDEAYSQNYRYLSLFTSCSGSRWAYCDGTPACFPSGWWHAGFHQ